MIEKLRTMLIAAINRQFKVEHSISTTINLYMVEVQMLKSFVYLITGTDDSCDDADLIHDLCCNFIDKVHGKFDQ
ncbi:MAG: hypothetical protein J6Y02_03935 [Pseudobutyrivibrio sp.]|nr:hypothetical protein [Pseudobutyrivibrio sp.]